MTITNKQHLANLLHYMHADNVSGIILPSPNEERNSSGDYLDTWYSEFVELRESDQENTIDIDGDGVYLYGYKFFLDGKPVCYVTMEYEYTDPRGCTLVDDDGISSQKDLVRAWLGNTTLDEHDGDDIIYFARIAGIDYDGYVDPV